MVVEKGENVDGIVVKMLVGDARLEQVENFTYPGSTPVDDGNSGK